MRTKSPANSHPPSFFEANFRNLLRNEDGSQWAGIYICKIMAAVMFSLAKINT